MIFLQVVVPCSLMYNPNNELAKWYREYMHDGTHRVRWHINSNTMIIEETLMINFKKKFDL